MWSKTRTSTAWKCERPVLQTSLGLSPRREARSQLFWRCAWGKLQEKKTCSSCQKIASHLCGGEAPSSWDSLKQPVWGQGTDRQSPQVPLWFPKRMGWTSGQGAPLLLLLLSTLPSSSQDSSSLTFSYNAAENILFLLSLDLRRSTQSLCLTDSKKRYPALVCLALSSFLFFPLIFLHRQGEVWTLPRSDKAGWLSSNTWRTCCSPAARSPRRNCAVTRGASIVHVHPGWSWWPAGSVSSRISSCCSWACAPSAFSSDRHVGFCPYVFFLKCDINFRLAFGCSWVLAQWSFDLSSRSATERKLTECLLHFVDYICPSTAYVYNEFIDPYKGAHRHYI